MRGGRAVGHHAWSLELHRKLLADSRRNHSFDRALSRVSRGAVVADIGAGTGFLSFLALKHHAERCHLYEADLEVCSSAERTSHLQCACPLSARAGE